MNFLIGLKTKITGFKILVKRLGWKKTLLLLPNLLIRQIKGEPFKSIAKSKEIKDKKSRQLIKDAILVYRALLDILEQNYAEALIREIIRESAITQLSLLIPPICSKQVLEMQSDQRKEKFCDIINQFPNADWSLEVADDTVFEFVIAKCRLVELTELAGHPELKDAFCAGDSIYFEKYQSDILFNCKKKIGEGESLCNFKFELKNE